MNCPFNKSVQFEEEMLILRLRDGRALGMPLGGLPSLANALERELHHYELIGHGSGLHWPDLDAYISVRSILLGRHTRKS